MAAKNIQCTGCGAPMTIRAEGSTQSVACEFCGSVLDAQDPQFKVLSQYKSAVKFQPLIPLGQRGTLRGEKFECIGYMRRTVRYYGVDYAWSEYLLYNPYKGYRFLLENKGHWIFLQPCVKTPEKKKGILG